jgi:hypothetical protein
VQVLEEPFDDEAGEYRYCGVVFRFIFGDREFRARRSDNRPGEAHFLGYSFGPNRTRGLFEAIPYDEEEFREAAFYHRDTVGADHVDILLPGGYSRLDFSRFPGSGITDTQSDESIHCFQCRALIPEGNDRCPKCGWTWE